MLCPRQRRLRLGIIFQQPVKEGGFPRIADAVDVAGRLCSVGRVEGGEFGGLGFGGGEEGVDGGVWAVGGVGGGGGDAGEEEAG